MEKIISGQESIKTIKKLSNLTQFKIEYDNGFGNMKSYTVFPGVDIVFLDFCSFNSFECQEILDNIIEINYCRKGRYESIFEKDKYDYLVEGNVGLSLLVNGDRFSTFSMGYYEGCSILIDSLVAGTFFDKNYKDININIANFKKKVFSKSWYCMLRTCPQITKVFEEIYKVDSDKKIYFYKLKVLEILVLLQNYNIKKSYSRYYTRDQIEKIREIKDSISENYNKKITVRELSESYKISTSLLQSCFKDLYGKNVAEYIREYRMYLAAKMIKETDNSILEISLCVGYDNPSKFASAFRKLMGKTPKQYRIS